MYAGNNKKKNCILSSLAAAFGCGGSCRRPKISSVFHPRPRRHHNRHYSPSTSGDHTTTTITTTTFSSASDVDSDFHTVQGFGKIDGAGFAVEKDSDDPYLDFRQSMLQMILEKEMYSKEDLKELLNCFLQLNSPYYHGIIVRAFTEIWNGAHAYGSGYGYSDPGGYGAAIWV